MAQALEKLRGAGSHLSLHLLQPCFPLSAHLWEHSLAAFVYQTAAFMALLLHSLFVLYKVFVRENGPRRFSHPAILAMLLVFRFLVENSLNGNVGL